MAGLGIKAVIQLICPAGAAKPGPAIGQALGPHGINMMQFVKEFNAETQKMEKETPVPVILTAKADRTFSFVCRTPPTSYLIRKHVLGLEKGAHLPGTEVVGEITKAQIRAVADVKKTDTHVQHISYEAICRSIEGTAKSMGVAVLPEESPEEPATPTAPKLDAT